MSSPPPAAAPWTALALSLGLALWALGPLISEPAAFLAGDWTHPDTLSNHWLLAWVAEQALSLSSLVHNDRYYWPVGDSPLLAGNGAEGFVYLPFHAALGWPRAVPPYLLAVLTLGGWSAWALARQAGGGPWASLVAVGAFGASPYVFQELAAGRFSQADVAWLLLFLAAWLRFLRAPAVWSGALAGLAFAATGFFYWYYAWFGLMAAVVLALAHDPRRLPRGPLLAFAAAALALLGPWLALHLVHWAGIPGTAEAAFPHPESRLDVATATLAPLVERGREASRAQPLPLWLLSVAGGFLALRQVLWPRPGGPPRRLAAGLLAVWALFAALSFGPAFPGAPYTVVYGGLAVLRRFWWPLRHTVVVHAVQAVFAAWALGALGAWLRGRLRRDPTAALAVAVALSGPPLLAARHLPAAVRASPMNPPPPVWLELARLPDGVLVEPPLAPELAGTQQHLLYQRWHGKTLLSGHALWVDRVRPDDWDLVLSENSLLDGMQRMERGHLDDGRFAFDPVDLERLRRGGVRWFAVNREALPLAARSTRLAYEALFTALFGLPVLRGEGVKVWDLEQWTGLTEVALPPAPWPEQLVRPAPDQPLVARRPQSPLFPEARATGGDPPPESRDP